MDYFTNFNVIFTNTRSKAIFTTILDIYKYFHLALEVN